ncbi:MAG TPA: DUF3795 domain-containing protein [Thermotogaceae bacterium]|nr:DUF3795 domain-containing protein [Thermotogaceae bacterium]
MRKYESCGIDCSRCPVYVATVNSDEKLREETAKKWSKEINLEIEAKDLVCYGCKSGQTWKMCKDCPFVECCKEKGLNNCGEYESYPCPEISKFLKSLPSDFAFLDQVYKERFPD